MSGQYFTSFESLSNWREFINHRKKFIFLIGKTLLYIYCHVLEQPYKCTAVGATDLWTSNKNSPTKFICQTRTDTVCLILEKLFILYCITERHMKSHILMSTVFIHLFFFGVCLFGACSIWIDEWKVVHAIIGAFLGRVRRNVWNEIGNRIWTKKLLCAWKKNSLWVNLLFSTRTIKTRTEPYYCSFRGLWAIN
jgi:hypothetical protein